MYLKLEKEQISIPKVVYKVVYNNQMGIPKSRGKCRVKRDSRSQS